MSVGRESTMKIYFFLIERNKEFRFLSCGFEPTPGNLDAKDVIIETIEIKANHLEEPMMGVLVAMSHLEGGGLLSCILHRVFEAGTKYGRRNSTAAQDTKS